MIESRKALGKRIFLIIGGWMAAGILGVGWMSPAFPATKVLTGKHAIVYDIVNPTGVEFLPDYSNNSYRQKVLQQDEFSRRVLIEVNLAPLNSTAPFPVSSQQMPSQMRYFLGPGKDIPVNEGNILSQARALTQGSRTVHEAVTAIFNWIVDNFTYDAGRNTPQDGRSVFYSKRGSCVGFTNLAIAMLRSLGIPARYAHGYLPPGYDWGISKKYWGVQISGGGYHAWVEVYYPDVGWCFSDLLHSKNFVDPFHVLRYTDGINLNPRNIQGGSLDVEDATTFTIFQEENATLAIDQLPLPKKDFLARQTGSQQFGTIYGKIKDSSGKSVAKGSLVLWEGIQGKIIPFEDGLYSLLGLNDGNYRVTIRAEGYSEVEKNIQARKGEVKQVDLVLPPPRTPKSTPASKTNPPSRTKP
jgi:hypothetical protein